MTTTVYYPSNLRYAIQAGKSRDLTPKYRSQTPQSGTPYFLGQFSGQREEWQFDLIFNRWDATRFESWLNEYGSGWFWFPIKDEFGFSLCDCHFTNDGFPTCTDRKEFRYSMKVAIRGKLDVLTHDGVPLTHDGDYLTYGE